MVDEAPDLDEAYAVETPEDNRNLYRHWASTYDEKFVAAHGYIYPQSVARVFAARVASTGFVGPLLDVGCGTGVVGEALRQLGYDLIDGVDISPEMLDIAATKRGPDGSPVYRNLTVADLTAATSIPTASFDAVISAGTFTHGHLGPEPIGELLRIARPGATMALGINAEHFESAGFGLWFSNAIDAGAITDFEIIEVPIYDPERYTAADAESHVNDMGSVAVCRAKGS